MSEDLTFFILASTLLLKSPPALWKVKAQAKAEKKAVKSLLNLDLDLSLLRLLRVRGRSI